MVNRSSCLKWVNGVLIDGHKLRIVGSSINQDLTKFSLAEILGVSDNINGFAG